MDEICPRASPVQNHHAETTSLSFAWPGDPLLDDPSSEVGIDQAAFGICNRLAQGRIIKTSFSSESGKGLVLEYPYLPREALQHRHFSCIALSVIDVNLSSGTVFTRWLSGDARNIATTSVANAFFPHTKSCADAKCAGLERRSVKTTREGTRREGTRQAGQLNPLSSIQHRPATGRTWGSHPFDSGTNPCSPD